MMASELWGEDHASFCELIIKYTELHSSGDPPADETEFNPHATPHRKNPLPKPSKKLLDPDPHPPAPKSPDIIEATHLLNDKAGFLTGMEKERLEMNKAITIIGILAQV